MGPLASLPALDVMWISFYSIGLLMVSMFVIYFTRNKVNNVVISFVLKFIAYAMFALGSFLMVLVVATWPA